MKYHDKIETANIGIIICKSTYDHLVGIVEKALSNICIEDGDLSDIPNAEDLIDDILNALDIEKEANDAKEI